jgi:hypothetical protein
VDMVRISPDGAEPTLNHASTQRDLGCLLRRWPIQPLGTSIVFEARPGTGQTKAGSISRGSYGIPARVHVISCHIPNHTQLNFHQEQKSHENLEAEAPLKYLEVIDRNKYLYDSTPGSPFR